MYLNRTSRRRSLLGALTGCVLAVSLATAIHAAPAAPKLCGFTPVGWSTNLGLATKERRGDPLPFSYSNVLFAISLIELAERTKDQALRTYAEDIARRYVMADGSLAPFPPKGFDMLETTPTGRILVELNKRTGDERYKKAAERVLELAQKLPRSKEGVIAWRPEQVWVDGLWHTLPFYAEYAGLVGEPELFDDIRTQYTAFVKHSRDPKTGLAYHGWDESHERFWANPETGTSTAFWARASGWYGMSLVDVIDEIPTEHPARAELTQLLKDFAASIVRYQDKETGLWWQVMDQPTLPGNYQESSSAAMFVYTLARGVNRGHLDRRFAAAAIEGYKGLIRDKVRKDPQGKWTLGDIVRSAGLGNPPEWPPGSPPPSKRDAQIRGRDGSAQYYVEQPLVNDHSYGIGPFVLAGFAVEDLLKSAVRSDMPAGFKAVRCAH